MTFTPTAEQLAIVAAARDTTDNLLVSALAGAAKTSTLELVAQALPDVNAVCLAFNKRIADEMKTRMPLGYSVLTLNSLGHRCWAQTTGLRLRLDTSKCFKLFSGIADTLKDDAKKDLYNSAGFILKSVQQLKAAGWVPEDYPKTATSIIDDVDAYSALEEHPDDLEWDTIKRIYTKSLDQSFEGTIDFADQLLMPTVFRATFPIHSLILVDEAQDLSELNHAMLRKLYRKRIIAVGDQCQAIYAFRGAHESGMEELKHKFQMRELHLSCSFRCPEAVVKHVQWRAPRMTHWAGNPTPGEIRRLATWDYTTLPDDCAVICRNNAPLFRHAIGLLKSGRYPNLWGSDIASGILKIMKNLGALNMDQRSAKLELELYRAKQLEKVRGKRALEDRCECIGIFLDANDTLGGAIAYAEHIFASKGRVHFMTGHKSKGHEFDDVFILDEQLLGDEGQELNLRYVMATRAKRTLSYINTNDLVFEEDEAA